MSDSQQKNILKKLLLYNNSSGRLWAALVALFVGNVLLLTAVLIWWNFNELLYGKDQGDSLGSTFVIVGKKVTNTNIGIKDATSFTEADIDSITRTAQVQQVGVISANRFPVWAVLGGSLGMSTDLPLESVPDSFLDQRPEEWNWQPGSRDLPIIMSSQFLDLYNYVFAPSQGLPQLSESSVKSLSLTVKAGPPDMAETYSAHVVGFSDRINSVMVPQSFIDYGNKKFARQGTTGKPSQLILKIKDPSDKRFTDYLRRREYTTNSQNLRWSRMREIVQVVSSATGVLAVLLLGIGTLVFVLFIELTIARAHQSLVLLKELGYSPARLTAFMLRRFIPLALISLALSGASAAALQLFASRVAGEKGLTLHLLPGMPVWVTLGISTALLLLLITRSVKKAIE